MTLEQPSNELVSQAQTGDSQAFDALVREYRERLERQIQARMGPTLRVQLEPADILQETLAKAFVSIRHFEWKGEDSFYRWLGSIAQHLIWNASKKKTLEPLRLEPKGHGDTSGGRRLRRAERFDRLEAALRDLSPQQRKAVMLTRIEGLSLSQAAERMGRSPGAVQKLVARSLLELRRSIGETESLHLPERSLREGEAPEDE